jgi:hypothetical protein
MDIAGSSAVRQVLARNYGAGTAQGSTWFDAKFAVTMLAGSRGTGRRRMANDTWTQMALDPDGPGPSWPWTQLAIDPDGAP